MEETKNDSGDLQIYEIGYHILPSVAEGDVAAEVSKINSVIKEKGGAMISEEFPELRSLAYDITKKIDTRNFNFSKAYFGWVKFEIDRSVIGEIKDSLEKQPNILRFIVVKTVRENTIYTPKSSERKSEKEDVVDTKEARPQASEEEMDKSIDELVVGESL